jgi:hypothetical protein
MKITKVVALAEVSADLLEGKAFYDGAELGVGDYFWDSLIADMESLIIYAGIHKRQFGFFVMYARRFPYGIYYQVRDETAEVVAVLPLRRNPLWIGGQLAERG